MMTILLLVSAPAFANPARLAAWCAIKIYQATLSELQPDVCNYHPSCSRYAEAAVKKHGVVGVLMASDRLLRCNPYSWAFLGTEYSLEGGKLHEDMEDYYILGTPRYSRRVMYPW